MNGLDLSDPARGKTRPLTRREVTRLRQSVGLAVESPAEPKPRSKSRRDR